MLNAGPDVVNHNLEAVKSIFKIVRPKGDYNLSLDLLSKVKEIAPKATTKSGFMVGLGETKEQIIETIKDLKKRNCDIVTIGQYLQPSSAHFPVQKYYKPGEFQKIKLVAEEIGIKHVFTGPLVRSSYKADVILQKI